MSTESSESSLQLDLLAWFEVNKRRIGTLFGVVAILVVALIIYRWSRKENEAAASQALLSAFLTSPNASATEPTVVPSDTLIKLAQDHSGTQAGHRATLLAAGQLFSEGKYEQAREKFELFRQQYADSDFAPIAALGVASSLDALNKTTEAMAAYQTIAGQYGNSFVSGTAKLAKARLHESLKQPDQALAIYDDLSKVGPFTPLSQQATMRREQLLGVHPELVKATPVLTNAVNVLPAPTVPAK